MPITESTTLVARFLRSNHYNETLETFLKEAGLPDDAGSLGPGEWTIEQILKEKVQFDTSLAFEKQGNDGVKKWTDKSPSHPHEPRVDVTSNVLSVNGDTESNTIFVTSADRSWKDVSGSSPYDAREDAHHMNDSPVLSSRLVGKDLVLSTAMSGHLAIRHTQSHALVDECRHHAKYAVQAVSYLRNDAWIIATIGWDQKILFYAPDRTILDGISLASGGDCRRAGVLGDPVHTQTLPSNPESIVFVQHPDTHDLYLVASRRDSTHLYYYLIKQEAGKAFTVHEAGRQNLAPHSNAWVAFSPSCIAICPTDPTLIAVATSQLPHMKLIIVRLLFPGTYAGQFSASDLQTQASVARAELALQDREDAAIKVHVSTMAPQTPYSTPQVVWRPDGSGLFVNGDDGVIRGVEASTGKVISLLKGHEVGSKVRTLWAGMLKGNSSDAPEEVLVSGGFDKKLLVWTTQ